MKNMLLIFFILFFAAAGAGAWDNPHKAAAPEITIAADKPSQITLENRRVQTITGDTFTYDTGARLITIEAESLTARHFLRDVQNGRRSARAGVTLTPVRQSPFNTAYTAR